MKNWLKQQVTEFTAWMGLFLCTSVFFTPDWVTFCFGLLLIAIDDVKASEWVQRIAPWCQSKIDEVSE